MEQNFLSTRIFIKFANYQQYAIMNILVMKKKLKPLLLTVLSVLSFTYTHAQSDIPFNINHGPYLQEVTADGASFNFTTSHPAFSFIELKLFRCLNYFSQRSSQLKKVLCQSTPFCGFSTQWLSSGKSRSSAGIPLMRAALNAPIPWFALMR